MSGSAVLVWFRRDLRAEDHTALAQALARFPTVYCAFVFDTEILDPLPSRRDRRVEFIWHACAALDSRLRESGGALITRHGAAREIIPRLAKELGVAAVYTNHDYEPGTIARDTAVKHALAVVSIEFASFKDQVVFERDEVLTQSGTPFSVFTPYKNAWLKKVDASAVAPRDCVPRAGQLMSPSAKINMLSLADIGFETTNLLALKVPTGTTGGHTLLEEFLQRIDHYAERRDFPAVRGPSYLSVHLRFGTISIRELVRQARARRSQGAQVWLSELIWREFYFQILAHHPHVVGAAFKPDYDRVVFDDDETKLQAWRNGRTGYPIIDAAMRQLNETGYMHNRLRMIVASFLTKDLHIHWRHGERYFAEQLIDFDLAANNGGWQWAASSGCDAQPYFRIFNPLSQSERFDPEGKFIRKYLPQLAGVPNAHIHAPWHLPPLEQTVLGCVIGRDYPAPIVDHDWARKLTLERYSAVRKPG